VAELSKAPGQCWIAPLPRCPVHGQMHYRSQTKPSGPPELGIRIITRSEWICHGWDGEGCDHVVNSDDLPWTLAGRTAITGTTLTELDWTALTGVTGSG
jgi:hypothetical protein